MILVQIVSLFASFTDDFAGLEPFFVLFSFSINVFVFCTVVFFNDLLTYSFIIQLVAFITFFTNNFTVVEPFFVLLTLDIDVFVFCAVIIFLWDYYFLAFIFIVEFIALFTFFAYCSASGDPFTMLFSFGINVLILNTVVIFLWNDNLLAFTLLIKFIVFITLFADNLTAWYPFFPFFSLMINVFVLGAMIIFFWNYNFLALSFIIKLIAFFAFLAYYFTSCNPFAPLFSLMIDVFVFSAVIIFFRNLDFNTFPLVVQLITFVTLFTDLFASSKPLMVFLSLYINPFILGTMIILWFGN